MTDLSALPPVDHSQMALGKLAPKKDPRLLMLHNYLETALPPTPSVVNWAARVGYGSYPMLKNDAVGDCTCAGALHLSQTWLDNTGTSWTPTDDEALAAYTAITGYNPSDPSTDQGAVEEDVLKYWRQTGIGGQKIQAFMGLDPSQADFIKHIQLANYLFGGTYLGISLPVSAQTGIIWDVVGDPKNDPSSQPGSWGGHCVPAIAHVVNSPGKAPDGTAYKPGCWVVTWGALKYMTWDFFTTYVDEAYAVLSLDWFNKSGIDPSGFREDALQQDLNAFAAAA
jgi:hypothetical protein